MKDKLSQTGYHSILQHHVIPSGTRLVGQGFLFMQDNDPKHTSKQHVLQVVSWPARSADFELEWDELDREVKTKRATNTAHLWKH